MLMRKRHRKQLLQQPFPSHWDDIIATSVPYAGLLNEAEQRKLRETITILIDEKYWEGCGGLEINEHIQVVIASQAAILLLAYDGSDYFHNVRTLLIYPAAYVQSQERVGSDGLVHAGSANLGEAWYNGPVVLSWQDAMEASTHPGRGRNVVFHEMAHTIDMLTGSTNGTPMLRHRQDYAKWHQVMSTAFTELQERWARGVQDPIRPYALTNVAEFFAVTTECFFDAPMALQNAHPAVYQEFVRFWGQDPAARAWPVESGRTRTSKRA